MRRVVQWFVNAGRTIAVLFIAFVFLLMYGFARLGTLFIFNKEKRRKAVARLRGRLLRWAMTILGASFVKLGQVMSTRPDIFAPEMIDELRLLQDKLPAYGFRKVRQQIEGDLGGKLEDHFSQLDAKPIAAASVAQVHRGNLKDGREVAVKVLRPKVRAKAERDGVILVGFAKFLEFVSKNARLSEPVAHMQNFVEGIIGQTDLRNEAKNYISFKVNFAKVAKVKFPDVHEDKSSERVLTMEFCRGKKVDGLGAGDHRDVAKIMRNAFLKMCFEDGFVHSDLHPGNMLVSEDRRLVIFDVGLVKSLGDDVLLQFIDFSRCIAMGTAEDFINHLKRFHKYLGTPDWDAVTADAEKLVTKFRAQSNSQLEWGSFINEVFAIARKYAIRPIPELALVMVGLLTAEGIGKMLDPTNNTFNDIALFVAPIAIKKGLVNPAQMAAAAAAMRPQPST